MKKFIITIILCLLPVVAFAEIVPVTNDIVILKLSDSESQNYTPPQHIQISWDLITWTEPEAFKPGPFIVIVPDSINLYPATTAQETVVCIYFQLIYDEEVKRTSTCFWARVDGEDSLPEIELFLLIGVK